MKDVSSREVSKDSQRLRDWTQDYPVDDLLIKSIADSLMQFLLPFGACLTDRLWGYVIGPSLESAVALHQWAADTSRRPTLSERWAGLVRRGEGKRSKAPPGTPPLYEHWTACYTSRHTCNVRLPNNLAKHAFKGDLG